MVTPRRVDIGPLYKPDGSTALASATITFALVDKRGKNSAGYESAGGAQVAGTVSVVTDLNGLASASLVPNDQLLGTTYYNVSPADAYGYTRFRAYLTSGSGAITFAQLYTSDQNITPAEVSLLTQHSQNSSLHLTPDENAALSSANTPNAANPIATIADIGTGGSGETNTASNVGTGGVGVHKQKVGVDFEFKNINAGSNKLTVTDDVANSEIDIDVAEANITHDNLAGAGTNTHPQVDTHLASVANPHAVTAGQAGAAPVAHVTDVANPHAVTAGQVGLANVADLKVNLTATVAPISTDDSGSGYAVGSRWFDVTADKEYVCLDATATSAVWTETTGVGGGVTFGKNSIINGNFGINQRVVTGTVVLGAGVYGHDRWKAGASGCTYTFSTVANVTTITITAGSLIQVIEGANLFSDTYTLSWSGTAQGKIGAGAYSATGVTGAVTGGANLSIEFNTGTVSKIQLEQGAVPTSFEQRDISTELGMCQRYFATTFPIGTAPAQNAGSRGSVVGSRPAGNSNYVFGTWDLPVALRTVPTIITYNPLAANANWRNHASTHDITVDYTGFSSSRAVIIRGAVGSLTTDSAVFIQATADAEL